MCDYSLQTVRSRPATVGDRLTTRNFGTGTKGFAAPEDSMVAVCVLPGTELAFDKEVLVPGIGSGGFWSGQESMGQKTAIFRQINKRRSYAHHDALEFPDGSVVLLNELCEGQRATVLQLPAQPTTDVEKEGQRRVEVVG
jgi:hypothetical protein